MANISTRSIYQQNNLLTEQLPLLPFMKKKERNLFVEEVQAFIDGARQAERSTKSPQTKSRLQNIIEAWEKFLIDIKHIPVRKLPVISKVDKTSQALIEVPVEESSTNEFIRSFSAHVARLVSQIMSPSKVDPNTPMTIPHDPELRAIYDELYGIVDTKGRSK